MPELLRALEEKLTAENHIAIGAANPIVVTAGGNMAFMNALFAIADPGDEIILQTPYYFNHEMAVCIANCRPVLAPTDANYQLQPDAIRAAITPRTRAVVTISPNNPTGAVYAAAALREVNRICAGRGIYHIHDEAYENFTYDGAQHFSPASIPDSEAHTISLFSFSKAYGFASWRIGYMVIPEHLLVAVKKIQDTNLICAPVISQFAALGALQAGSNYCRARLAELTEVRAIVSKMLSDLEGICDIPRADGAFYYLLRLQAKRDPLELVERLVREHRVAVIPGNAFGMEGCYLRVSYGPLSKETAAEGIGRLVSGLKKLLSN
jgi:aspartate/methionine/tyrosine aminotransferase